MGSCLVISGCLVRLEAGHDAMAVAQLAHAALLQELVKLLLP